MYEHIPVLLEESTSYLVTKPDGIYVDATFGLGGHSKKILEKLSSNGFLVAIDKDEEAIELGKEKFKKCNNIKIVHSPFSRLDEVLNFLKIDKIDGILFDLGVSSLQLDKPERGFSYNSDSFLDMRMDKTSKLTAYDVVNKYSEKELERIIREYGEERYAKKIAKEIVKRREQKPITTTKELNDLINSVVPRPKDGSNPAKRTFQAIRIEVNGELEEIKVALEKSIRFLKSGGRICVISFHSLEDRIVKEFFKYHSLECICPKDIPVCVCGKKKELNILTKKPITPTKEEIERNKRSHSAKLRVAEKI
ncbi:S-adenosyl-methyltransferase MraW [Caldicellulosiruptor saccharolyticus DSM 8903]|uniref:Ribosomal RNA small subunit methyltransferase H n=1 Tax=Caldicellulosiruptor saccharolyticus (strain ATCC 43494 / DSM 8903 / Tp8T 6331) TaxID=351627 RepID=RSMH_CALS8|nr:16S rRNA (cytosine(1402)-N(4))-methyltransferase RsmH [Caldicellulosiruptor saccharolyticus]A4XHZ6.1 RecName: Full=Ribosomal RNA small subunit methyltransferase H; AltName: Full=16S rRNA m(4)C1402 methyltransferase; AltName: Full=rRNA (cytosine-N(4)-)-methyltransferase RsmH [Caldicellulosiruptor saccharolyticus DSM 8903]ABP66531.1 S-adenosyl-methyltransferase MraW [Caldicellulosiruptor saccharolyticus DSM 8903]